MNSSITKLILIAATIASLVWLSLRSETAERNRVAHEQLTGTHTVEATEKAIGHAKTTSSTHPVVSVSRTVRQAPSTQHASCNRLCQQGLNLIFDAEQLADIAFEQAPNFADVLAEQLRRDPYLKAEMIELIHLADGNKRKLILSAFKLLDANDQRTLAESLVTSNDRFIRIEGIELLASPDLTDRDIGLELADLLYLEPDKYVRSKIVKLLNQPKQFRDDPSILNALQEIASNDPDLALRGQALLTQLQLETDPEVIFDQSLLAIQSDAQQLQLYGIRALRELITLKDMSGEQLSLPVRQQIKHFLAELAKPEFNDMPTEIRQQFNDIAYQIL